MNAGKALQEGSSCNREGAIDVLALLFASYMDPEGDIIMTCQDVLSDPGNHCFRDCIVLYLEFEEDTTEGYL